MSSTINAMKQAVEVLYANTCYYNGGDPISEQDAANDKVILHLQEAIAREERRAAFRAMAAKSRDGFEMDTVGCVQHDCAECQAMLAASKAKTEPLEPLHPDSWNVT